MRFAWIDLRSVPGEQREAVIDAAIHVRVDAVLDSDPATLARLPPTIKRVLADDARPEQVSGCDLMVLREVADIEQLTVLHAGHRDGEQVAAALVNVVDDRTLTLACKAAASQGQGRTWR